MEELTFNCPVCGANVLRRAKSCPDCGACEKSGWSQDRYSDGLSLPGNDFDYDEYAARELGSGRSKQSRSQRWWMIVGIILIIAMVLMTLRGLW